MKKIFLLSAALMIFIIISCKKDYPSEKIEYNVAEKGNNSGGSEASGHIKIAVVSDIYYMHPLLIHDNAPAGEPFKTVASMHRPTAEYSAQIFDEVLSELLQERPDIVLISGNLALDGEKISHQAVADNLKQLLAAGMKVYVTPGRYDIKNPRSAEYYFDHSARVPNVSSDEFKSIYAEFGYNNTNSVVAKDPNSLTYIARPFPGLWILSIDAVKYTPYASSGRIRPETMNWILGQLAIAKEKNITVLGLMGHNLIEHLKDHNKIRPNTLIENWQADADALIKAGLQVIFTGTFHATDITMRQTDGQVLYDIQTGTLLNPTSPYRLIILKNKELDISTEHVTHINASLPGNMSFEDYSYKAFSEVVDRFFSANLFGAPPRLATEAVVLAKDGLYANFAGDEKLSPIELDRINAYAAASPDSTRVVVGYLMDMWTDLNTKDNKWHIKLTN